MMNNLVDLFAPAVALATVLASIAIWAPRKAWIKVGAVAAAALFMPLAYTAFAGLLGKPKPVQLEWVLRTAPEATVIAASVHEGEAIFLWLRLDDVAEPRAYALPWSRAVAEQLQAAQREAEHNRNGVRMTMPFETGTDGVEHRFYAAPQPALPAKDRGGDGPVVFEHPGV